MPVQPSKKRTSRSVILGVAGIAVGIILVLVLFVIAIPSLTESGTIEVKLGSDTYDAGSAESRASNIAEGGPLLFSDVSSGSRDIYLQHIGSDPKEGWLAFDARPNGTGRECTLRWNNSAKNFTNPCTNETVSAEGTGLTQYNVTITENGKVIVNLKGDEATKN